MNTETQENAMAEVAAAIQSPEPTATPAATETATAPAPVTEIRAEGEPPPWPDHHVAHRIALAAASRIPADTFADIANEVSLAAGVIIPGDSVKGLLVLAIMDGVVAMQSERLQKAGLIPIPPLTMSGRHAKMRALTVLDEAMQLKRFNDFWTKNFTVASEKDEATKQFRVNVQETERLDIGEVPVLQAREVCDQLRKCGCSDPEGSLNFVLRPLGGTVRDEATVLPFSGAAQRMLAGEEGEGNV